MTCFNLQLLCFQQLPDLVTQLGVLYHLIENRVKMFHKLSKLHGKLFLLITQVSDLCIDLVRWRATKPFPTKPDPTT